jgi:N-methylhydantoinase A
VSARPAYFGVTHGLLDTPVLGRADVPVVPLAGPAIVEEYDATTVVPPGWTIRRGELDTLLLEAAP